MLVSMKSPALILRPNSYRFFNINVCPDPIVRRRDMSLTSSIFGEEYVTGQKCLTRAVTKLDINAASEGNDPTPMARGDS
jgi:hypothetical protein